MSSPNIADIGPMASEILSFSPVVEAGTLRCRTSGWETRGDVRQLSRTFLTASYADAFEVGRRVAEICEREGSYPDLAIGSGYCRVTLSAGVNDANVASKINDLMSH